MKNWGKFFILILIITVLTACGQKGEGGGVTGNPTNPYTWSELYEMIGVGELPGIDPSNLNDNRDSLVNLKSSSLITSTDEFEINSIINILNKINVDIINKDSTFNYFTSVDELDFQDRRTIDILKVISLDDLKALKEELDFLYQNNLSDPTLRSIRTNVEITLNSIGTRKDKNPFYATTADLFSQYHYNLKVNADYLNNTYNLDIDKIDQKKEIKASLDILYAEILKLEKNIQDLQSKPELERHLKNLKDSYEGYLASSSTMSKINDMRLSLRLYENQEFGNTSSQLFVYNFWIKDVSTQLDNYTSSDASLISLKEKFKTYLYNNYHSKMTSYDSQDYLSINSKAVTVLDVLQYLKNNDQELAVQLGLSLGWSN